MTNHDDHTDLTIIELGEYILNLHGPDLVKLGRLDRITYGRLRYAFASCVVIAPMALIAGWKVHWTFYLLSWAAIIGAISCYLMASKNIREIDQIKERMAAESRRIAQHRDSLRDQAQRAKEAGDDVVSLKGKGHR